jgi:hypothetical protein
MDKNQFLSEKIKKLIQEGYSRSQASAIAYGQLNKASYAQQAEYPMYPDELKENGYVTEIVPNQSDYSEITEDDTVDQLEYEPQKEVWQIWQEKTGLPWKDAKRLGYTDGSAKDNMKLLQEITSNTFDANKLRKEPIQSRSVQTPSKKEEEITYNGGQLKEVIIKQPKKKSLTKDQLEKIFGKREYGTTGDIKQKQEVSDVERVGEILGNPFQSFGHYAKYSELPAAGFSKNQKMGIDRALGVLNPAFWANAGANAVDFAEGGDSQRAVTEAFDALPALGKIKYVTYLKNLSAKELARIPGAAKLLASPQSTAVMSRASNAVRNVKQTPLNFYEEPLQLMPNYLQLGQGAARLGQGAKRLPMQQGGGLDMLKGKRIVDYKYNPRTGNYDIEYED